MKLDVRTQSQRDTRWGSQILGYNTNPVYNIYGYGCLITSLGNYVGKAPDEVNQLLKDNGGFVAGSGNFIWGKSTVLGITQTYLSPYYNDAVSAQGITKIKELIGQGLPLICEVDFNPADTIKQQHFVLLSGVDDVGNVLVVDPWEGQWETWSEAACKRNIYQFRAYDKVVAKDTVGEQVCMPKGQADDFNRVKDGWNQLRVKLNVEDNVTVVLSEVDKLIKYEDAVVDKDNQLSDAQTQINELRSQITQLQADNATLAAEASVLTVKASELEKKYMGATVNYEAALAKIKSLEDAIVTPVFRGWKKALVDLLKRL